MRRSRLESLLYDYLADDLAPDERTAVEELLRSDPSARALLDEVRGTYDALCLLRERPDPPLSATDAVAGIRAALVSDRFREKPKLLLEGPGTRVYRRLALAATLLFAVTAGLLVYSRLGGDDGAGAAAAPSGTPAAGTLDRRPNAAERGLEPFVEAGRRGGLDAAEWVRMLRERRLRPGDVRISPLENVLPISADVPDER